MRSYLTGATGFLGGYLLKKLVDRGDDVTCLVRSAEKAKSIRYPGVRMVEGDITDRRSIHDSIQGQKHVFHLAAFVQLGIEPENEESMHNINVTGTHNVLEEAYEAGTEKIIYVSSAVVIGLSDGPNDLLHETDYNPDDTSVFFSPYAKSKHDAHEISRKLIAKGAPIINILPGLLYGPCDTNIVAQQIKVLLERKLFFLTNAPSVFLYAFVEDVVSGILLAEEKGKIGEDYILGGENLTIEEFYSVIADAADCKLPRLRLPLSVTGFLIRLAEKVPWAGIIPDGLPLNHETFSYMKNNLVHSSEKAKIELGWKHTPISESLPKTVQWIMNHV